MTLVFAQHASYVAILSKLFAFFSKLSFVFLRNVGLLLTNYGPTLRAITVTYFTTGISLNLKKNRKVANFVLFANFCRKRKVRFYMRINTLGTRRRVRVTDDGDVYVVCHHNSPCTPSTSFQLDPPRTTLHSDVRLRRPGPRTVHEIDGRGRHTPFIVLRPLARREARPRDLSGNGSRRQRRGDVWAGS